MRQSSKKLWCFYCVYNNNLNNTKKTFRKSEVINIYFEYIQEQS